MAGATTARDLMTADCQCVKEDESVLSAAKIMADKGIGALPICGNDEKLHGMLTDRDIVVKCIAKGNDPSSCKVGEMAEGRVIWVSADADVREVLSRMEEHQIRRLPVIDENKKLVGIISQGDIATHLGGSETGELVGQVSQGPASQQPVGV